jgi:hypothetical protein
VPLAPINAFGTIVATNTTDTGRPDRLAVDDARARLRLAANADAEVLAEQLVNVLPSPVQSPQAKVVICRLPRRELVREQPPGTAAANDVEDGVQDLADRAEPWSANIFWRWQIRLKARKLGVGQVCEIRAPQWQTPAILPAKPTRVPVFRQSLVDDHAD